MDRDSEELFEFAAVAERTALAWQRTALGVVAVGALIVRWSLMEDFPVWPSVLLCAFGGLAGLFLVRQRYLRIKRTVRAGQSPRSRYLVPGATAFMVATIAIISAGVGIELTRL